MSGTGKHDEWGRQLGSKLGSQMSICVIDAISPESQLGSTRQSKDLTEECEVKSSHTGVLFRVDAALRCSAIEYHVAA